MSDDEGFLARWSRLKREQGAGPAGRDVARAAGGVPERAPVRVSEQTLERAPASAPPASVPVPAPPVDALPTPVDLASLPPIESIGAGSDISGYLVAGVPPELTQAALRSAWRTDPVIREFVEMADNQWDFNTPDAIPGFGALGAAEGAKALVARAATGSVEPTVGGILASLTVEHTAAGLAPLELAGDRPAENQVVSGVALEDSRVIDSVWHAGIVSLAEVSETSYESLETPAKDLEPAEDPPAPSRRLHGSALPKST